MSGSWCSSLQAPAQPRWRCKGKLLPDRCRPLASTDWSWSRLRRDSPHIRIPVGSLRPLRTLCRRSCRRPPERRNGNRSLLGDCSPDLSCKDCIDAPTTRRRFAPCHRLAPKEHNRNRVHRCRRKAPRRLCRLATRCNGRHHSPMRIRRRSLPRPGTQNACRVGKSRHRRCRSAPSRRGCSRCRQRGCQLLPAQSDQRCSLRSTRLQGAERCMARMDRANVHGWARRAFGRLTAHRQNMTVSWKPNSSSACSPLPM